MYHVFKVFIVNVSIAVQECHRVLICRQCCWTVLKYVDQIFYFLRPLTKAVSEDKQKFRLVHTVVILSVLFAFTCNMHVPAHTRSKNVEQLFTDVQPVKPYRSTRRHLVYIMYRAIWHALTRNMQNVLPVFFLTQSCAVCYELSIQHI